MKAGKADEAKEVLDVVFPPSHRVTRRRKLCIHAKNRSTLPALSIAAQLAPILSPGSIAPFGRDYLNVLFLAECAVEQVRVVGFIADEAGRELIEAWVCWVTARTALHILNKSSAWVAL